MPSRIAIVDDHALIAEACRKLLEPTGDVVGTFTMRAPSSRRRSRLKPDIVIMDISMPLLNGLDAARELKRMMPNVRIIILTMNEDPEVAAEAFRIGASGYLLKRSSGSELALAVREVMTQRYYLTPLLTRDLVGSLVHDHARKQLHQLTPRQRKCSSCWPRGVR